MNNTDGGAGGHLRQREGGREAEREREREGFHIPASFSKADSSLLYSRQRC